MKKEQLLAEISAIEKKINERGVSEKAKRFHQGRLNQIKSQLLDLEKKEEPGDSAEKEKEIVGLKVEIANLKNNIQEWGKRKISMPEKAGFFNTKIENATKDVQEYEAMIADIEEEILAAKSSQAKAAEEELKAKEETEKPAETSGEKARLLGEKEKAEKWLSEAIDKDEKELAQEEIDSIQEQLDMLDKIEKEAAEKAAQAKQQAQQTKEAQQAQQAQNKSIKPSTGESVEMPEDLKKGLMEISAAAEALFNACKGISAFL